MQTAHCCLKVRFETVHVVNLSDHHDHIPVFQAVIGLHLYVRRLSVLNGNDIQTVLFTDSVFLNGLSHKPAGNHDLADLHAVIQRNIIQEISGNQPFPQTDRHIALRIDDLRAQLLQHGSLLLAVAGVAVGGGGAAAAGALGAGQAAMLDYSRADETEADQIGLQFMIKAGYPPIGMVNSFKVLRQKAWMTGASVPAYLSTHPDIGDRINGIQARIHKMPKSVTARKTDNRRFKRMQILLWGRYGTPETALQRFRGSDALSLMGRGMVYSRQNNVQAAARAFDEAVAKAPRDSLVLREAGIFNYRKGSMEKARSLLQQALALDDRDYMGSFFYARLLDDDGRHSEAQGRFRKVLQSVPEDAEVHWSLARSYGTSGKTGLAYVHMTYAAIYSQNKKQAERYFDKAKGLASGTAEFRRMEKIYKERKEIWEKM